MCVQDMEEYVGQEIFIMITEQGHLVGGDRQVPGAHQLTMADHAATPRDLPVPTVPGWDYMPGFL